MKMLLLLICCICCLPGCGQNNHPAIIKNKPANNDKVVGGRCEGCEAIYESPVTFEQLNETDTLADFNDNGTKMEISGIIYKKDGVTPAADVIMYFYHTDQSGIYPKKGNEEGWAKQHGYLRGWIKTNRKGEYRIYTLRPASYPNSTNPAHIHATIKEPGKTAYWIDDFLFADDPLLPAHSTQHERAGNGVLQPQQKGNLTTATRNIYLGKNIPGYSE